MTLEFNEGQDFSVRYSLLHRIARSDSAQVWLALDKEGDERVCLKIFDGNADMLEKSEAAIQAGRGLIHVNIVRNYECGEVDGNLFISSSYVRSANTFNPNTINFTESWPLLEQLFSALEFAHSLQISHGHLHPGNLLLDDQDRLYITGFSLPASLSDKKSNNNAAYLTSEVQRGQAADSSDDVYSLGCIMFRLLTGQTWHPGETFEVNSLIPAQVQKTVAAMLASSPYDRLANLGEAREVLGNYAQGISTAQPIEIPQATFNRSSTASATSATSSPVHQLPRERHQISSTVVLVGFAVLLVLAGFVFFILPNTQSIPDITREKINPSKTPAPVAAAREESPEPQQEILAPLEIAQLECLKSEGKRIASELLRAQVELEDLGVLLWGGEPYYEISQLADSGDSFYREEKFREAMKTYEAALNRLGELKKSIPFVLEENLATGEAALNAGEVESAIIAWSIAHAIERDNKDIEAQLHRAENLDEVLSYVKTGDFHERELSLSEALKSYREATKLDPKWQPASEGVARVRLKIAKVKFTDAMSVGFSKLAAKQYDQSRQAFARAQEIFPKSQEPIDGLLQIDLAERMDAIDRYKTAAAEYVQQEDWSGAITEYESVLKLDQTLVFAANGLLEANERLELDATLNRFLAKPTVMRDDDEFTTAKTALVSASKFREPGAHLKQQLATLSRLITVARIPITVELTSDNKTEVTIYKVGNFGKISSREVQLYPGDYTIVGKRRGYRDVRRQLTLLAGELVDPIYISCIEKI
ncbi:MAG: protein kinase [Gammaproteobacteria bacterium]|nr:protein kinase [Gammaproteobacteria bacterium]